MNPLADYNARLLKRACPIAYLKMTAHPKSEYCIGNGQERPYGHMTITSDFTAHFHR